MPPVSSSPARRLRAFTLIELLAVLAIVAVLAGILIPVVIKTRAKARDSQCITNLRQIGLATGAYVADNRGFLPVSPNGEPGYPDGADRWYFLLAPYADKAATDRTDRGGQADIFLCPSNRRPEYEGEGGKWAMWYDFGYLSNLQLVPRLGTNGTATGPVRMASVNKRRILFADTTKEHAQFVYYGNTGLENSRVPLLDLAADGWNIHGKGLHALWTDYAVAWIAQDDVQRPGNQITGGQYFGRGN